MKRSLDMAIILISIIVVFGVIKESYLNYQAKLKTTDKVVIKISSDVVAVNGIPIILYAEKIENSVVRLTDESGKAHFHNLETGYYRVQIAWYGNPYSYRPLNLHGIKEVTWLLTIYDTRPGLYSVDLTAAEFIQRKSPKIPEINVSL